MTVFFTADEVLTATGGRMLAAGTAVRYAGVATDTRTLEPGALFVALSGERFDGHDFIDAAVRQGAAGIVASCEPTGISPATAVFLVPDTRLAYQGLARLHRCRFQLPVVAVTGSNGKTSTKDMIAAVLATRRNVLKTEANFNNEIGLSHTLLKIRPEHEAVVVEMGMRGLGEIAGLAATALPTVGVVTNVGETHLERLGSVDNIAAAKAELVEALPADGIAVLNGDDERVRNMRAKTAARSVFYGIQAAADVRAENLRYSAQGVEFDCRTHQGVFAVTIPVPGIHNVYNALAAIAVGLELGVAPADAACALAAYEPGKMRLNIHRYGEITVIDDTYNASPLSMAAAIDVLATVATGRKVAAVGDMLELGPAARSAHEQVGRQLAAAGVAAVLALGEMAAVAAATAREQGVLTTVACLDHAAAVAALGELLQPGDTLLLKGSRGMAMEKLLDAFARQSEV